jgi:hypothetical protein
MHRLRLVVVYAYTKPLNIIIKILLPFQHRNPTILCFTVVPHVVIIPNSFLANNIVLYVKSTCDALFDKTLRNGKNRTRQHLRCINNENSLYSSRDTCIFWHSNLYANDFPISIWNYWWFGNSYYGFDHLYKKSY